MISKLFVLLIFTASIFNLNDSAPSEAPVKFSKQCFNRTQAIKISNKLRPLRSTSKDFIIEIFNNLCNESIKQSLLKIEVQIEGYFGFKGETIGGGVCGMFGAVCGEILAQSFQKNFTKYI